MTGRTRANGNIRHVRLELERFLEKSVVSWQPECLQIFSTEFLHKEVLSPLICVLNHGFSDTRWPSEQEKEPMGTAGPLALAKEILCDGTGDPFFVLNRWLPFPSKDPHHFILFFELLVFSDCQSPLVPGAGIFSL